jgi:hypothetical protein
MVCIHRIHTEFGTGRDHLGEEKGQDGEPIHRGIFACPNVGEDGTTNLDCTSN